MSEGITAPICQITLFGLTLGLPRAPGGSVKYKEWRSGGGEVGRSGGVEEWKSGGMGVGQGRVEWHCRVGSWVILLCIWQGEGRTICHHTQGWGTYWCTDCPYTPA